MGQASMCVKWNQWLLIPFGKWYFFFVGGVGDTEGRGNVSGEHGDVPVVEAVVGEGLGSGPHLHVEHLGAAGERGEAQGQGAGAGRAEARVTRDHHDQSISLLNCSLIFSLWFTRGANMTIFWKQCKIHFWRRFGNTYNAFTETLHEYFCVTWTSFAWYFNRRGSFFHIDILMF